MDILSLVKGYEIPTEFPKEVSDEADRIPESVDVQSEAIARQNRTDYRDLPTVTIDGEDTKDIDDAISLVREGKKWKLGVHIADVAEYVKEGSALDKEAFNRGTSVYLADRVIPMLPRKLSNGICSLNAGEDRLAMSCVMTIDENGEVSEYEISESIIHVDARLSYNGVMRLFTENDDSEIAQSLSWQGYRGIKGRTKKLARMLLNMKKLAAQLRENREKRGSIDFDFPEAKIVLDEMGRPVEISLRERTDATDLIEDFMLLANETVARHCVYLEIPSVYRVHEVPAVDKMKELAQLVRGFGYRFKPGQGDVHPSQIRNLLEKMKGTDLKRLCSAESSFAACRKRSTRRDVRDTSASRLSIIVTSHLRSADTRTFWFTEVSSTGCEARWTRMQWTGSIFTFRARLPEARQWSREPRKWSGRP